MANPLAIALALYGGYKGYKAGKERGGTLGGIVGGALGAAGGFYGGQYLGGKLGMSAVPGTEGFTNTMMKPFAGFGGRVPVDPGMATESIYAGGNLPQIPEAQALGIGNAAPTTFAGKAMQFAKTPMGLGTIAGLGAYASGAFEPEPYQRMQFTYNMAYPELYRSRKFFVQDPVTGQTVEQPKLDYIPEENKKYAGDDTFGPYGYAMKTMNTGGLVEIAKFNEGGMPVKTTHDENDFNNYKRTNGYVADHTDGANKDEDTILAQLADGEFVTRTDGILGAGILMGASPNDEKAMRKKGAEFFYDQQKKMKRLYDLFNSKKAVN
jgi:hypothetical protein